MLPVALLLGILWGSSRYLEDRSFLSIALEVARVLLGGFVFLYVLLRWRHRRDGLVVPICTVELILTCCLLVVAIVSLVDNGVPSFLVVLLALMVTTLIPLVIYYTMRRDTKYWRMLGTPDKLPRSNTNLYATISRAKPATEQGYTEVASRKGGALLQKLIDQNRTLTVDFAFLDFSDNESPIASGATSIVYRGKYKTHTVAVKVFAFPELTRVYRGFILSTECC